MRIVHWDKIDAEKQRAILARPLTSSANELKERTRDILQNVASSGDAALMDYTLRFDHVRLESLAVSKAILQNSLDNLEPETRAALELAHENITKFHKLQLPQRIDLSSSNGVHCYRESRAIEKLGFYIPGGSAPLPSTVLMLGIPAQIVGNPIRILCSPPQADGEINPVILAAAKLCDIDQVYRVGGAQAIAAMAYGTESIPKVDKIFGPGNAWVTEAKLQVSADPLGALIDMPAGPSEVLVIADAQADPIFIAADLLSQAEHGPDSQVLLVTPSLELAQACLSAIDNLLADLPRREIAAKALQHSRCIIATDLTTAFAISNAYAPEHLIVHVNESETWTGQIQNAGSVFLGAWSPEAAGDYATGTNHVLPTYGYARSMSGLSIDSFIKNISFQQLTREGLASIGPAIERLAQIEGLEAHQLAVSVRLRKEQL